MFSSELSSPFWRAESCTVQQIHGCALLSHLLQYHTMFCELPVLAASGLSVPEVPRYSGGAENIHFISTVAIRLEGTAYWWIGLWCQKFLTSELCRGEDSASHSGRVKPRNEIVFNHWIRECVGFGPSLDAIEYNRTRVPRTTACSPVAYRFPYLDFWVQWHCTCKCVATTCAR